MQNKEKKYFKVYRSSAGSGKTYTLVKEYLQLVLAQPQKYRYILALTFTNKAAEEMKERILKQLNALAYSKNATNDTLAKDLQQSLQLSEETLRQNAKTVLESILHNYSDFAISTLDSFMHRVVNSFAYDLRLPLNFDVELETDDLIAEAVDTLLEHIGEDELLTDILMKFAESNFLQEKNWQIDRDLRQVSNEIFKENASLHLNKLKSFSFADFIQLAAELEGYTKSFEKTIESVAQSALQKIRAVGLQMEDFASGNSGIGNYFAKLCEFDFSRLEPKSKVLDTIENDKWHSGKASPESKTQIDGIKSFLQESFYQIQALAEKKKEYISKKLLLEKIYEMALLNEIYRIIDEQSTENSNLHISENNKRIAEVVQSEPVPYIYERIGEQYSHYFIDEFQDTSVLQWQNLLPLIDNALSKAQFSMIVGDGKQAIYRFRQGEVEQFVQLPEVYQKENSPFLDEREQTLKRNYELDVLQYNYRSSEEIVTFNNEFFEFAAKYLAEKHQPIYLGNERENNSNLKQIPIKKGGYIKLEFLTDAKKDKTQTDDIEENPNEACQKTLEAIQNALESGFLYADIAILTRNNKDLQTVAAFLNTQTIAGKRIPMVSSDSFLLWSSDKVRFLYALLQFIENPDLQLSQAAILQYLVQNKDLPNAVVERYFIENEHKNEANFLQTLAENGYHLESDLWLNKSLYDIVESLIRTFGLQHEADIYLSAFLNYTETFLGKPNQNITDFVQELQKQLKKLSAKMPKGLDAIQLMSIHRSKGLEFEVVIYPFVDSQKNNANSLLWVDCSENDLQLPTALVKQKKELAESVFSKEYELENEKILLDKINLFYVALTRAAKQLYLIMDMPSKSGSTLTYQVMMSQFLQEKGLWEESKQVYEFGEKTLFSQKENNTPHDFQNTLTNFISTDWSKKLLIENKGNDWQYSNQSIQRGLLVHEALSKIKTEKDIARVVAFLSAEKMLPQEKSSEFEQFLTRFINQTDVKPFFAEGLYVKTEVEILLKNGKTLRPDRLILSPSETILIDFKTGKELPSHIAQINEYKTALQHMELPSVKGFLLYIREEDEYAELIAVQD